MLHQSIRVQMKISEIHLERFEKKYTKPDTGCWNWHGAKTNYGYGNFSINGTPWKAHRLSVALYGDVDGNKGILGKVVMHMCDNTSCVNPKHLKIGTQADNIRDRDEKGRQNIVSRISHAEAKMIKESELSDRRLARMFNVSSATIWKVRNDKLKYLSGR